MSEIIVEQNSLANWQKLVSEAEAICQYHLDEDLESYLVFTLMRFLDKPEFISRIIAVDYLNSLKQEGQVRQDNLREVGDHCLLFSGLFPKIAEKRRVALTYFIGMGQSAYIDLSETCKSHLSDFYQNLASAFIHLMDILHAIAGMRQDIPIISPLSAVELWQAAKSTQSLKSLENYSNSLPTSFTSKTKH